MITVRLGEPLASICGRREIRLSPGDLGDLRLSSVLKELVKNHPAIAGELIPDDPAGSPDVVLFLNGTPVRPGDGESTLKDGDELTILYPIAGGDSPSFRGEAEAGVGAGAGEVETDELRGKRPPGQPPVVDFHVHPAHYETYHSSMLEWVSQVYGSADILGSLAEKCSDPGVFLELLDEAGVDFAVILAELSPTTTGIASNELVRDFCQGQERLIPFACINPYLTSDPARELCRLVEREGFRGLKLYPAYNYFYPNDRELYPVYAAAQDLGIPVMVHTGSSVFRGARLKYADPLFLDDVAVDFPELNLLAVHSGRGFWYDRAFFLARLHPNLYMEISGLPPQRLLSYFPEFERNADKIIYGSDWPGVPHLVGNVRRIKELPISQEVKDKILGLNAARLLGIPS